MLTLKAPPMIHIKCNALFCLKLRKMLLNLSSVAVVIDALTVKLYNYARFEQDIP